MLPGNYLLLAGDALNYRLPMSANHIARYLGKHCERLDVVGFISSYGGPPASSPLRLVRSARNLISDRVRISSNGRTRGITIRKFHMPEMLDMAAQGLWVYPNLRPLLAPVYEVGLIYGHEHILLMKLLKMDKRVKHLVYIDVDNHASYYSDFWSGFVEQLEKTSVHMVDGVISVSRPLEKLRHEQGADRVRLVPNGVDFELFQEARLNRTSHPPTLIYIGTLDKRWGVDLAIEALPLIREKVPDVNLVIVGKGPAKQEFVDLARSHGVADAVRFHGLVPQKELPNLMAVADIGIATSRENAFRQFASPLKINEYMAAGLPSICSGGGDAEKLIKESGAGINIPFSREAFVDAVMSFLNSKTRMADASEAGVNFARSLSWEVQISRIAEFIAEVAELNGSNGKESGKVQML